MPLTLITSNPNKVRELSEILKGAELETKALDLREIQSFQTREVVEAKARQAFEEIQAPVLVEDVSFELDVLGGFPGPFVKFWEKRAGYDLIASVAHEQQKEQAIVRCGVGYADAHDFLYAEAEIHGRFVPRRGGEGWGFDYYFIPDGHEQTYSEMGPEKKNTISHRLHAWVHMRETLRQANILP